MPTDNLIRSDNFGLDLNLDANILWVTTLDRHLDRFSRGETMPTNRSTRSLETITILLDR